MNNQIYQQTKQEILELSIIKRHLIDEIANLKVSQTQTDSKEEGTVDDSRLSGRDFDDLTREELSSMLAKSRDEIIFLRSSNNRQKSKYED